MKYKLEDLKYPIAIHIKTKEQWKLLRDKGVDINDTYLAERPYMLVGCGCLSAPYTGRAMSTGESYINISFEDIILKVSMIEDQWYKTTDNRWLFKYKKNGNGGINGSDTEFSKCYNSEYKTLTVNNWIGANSKYTIIKVTNMEEVYKHFPEERTELTSLPEQWCIKPNNKEEARVIGRWFDKNHNSKNNNYYEHNSDPWGVNYFHSNAHAKCNVYFTSSEGHGEEITFEQFKKWVLKEGDTLAKPYDVSTLKKSFIVGKWYKATTDYTNYYIKFQSLTNKGDYNTLYGETINAGSYSNADTWSNSAFEKEALERGYLTDLSEIQQFLPKGHPDLIIKAEIKEKSLIGRYLKVLKPYERKGHSYLLINKKTISNLPNYTTKEYPDEWMDIGYRVHNKEFELMPEGWIPEVKNTFVVKDTIGYDREFTGRKGGVWRNGVTADYQQIEKVPALITIKRELLLDTEVNYTELVRTELIKPKKVVLF